MATFHFSVRQAHMLLESIQFAIDNLMCRLNGPIKLSKAEIKRLKERLKLWADIREEILLELDLKQ